MAARILLVDDDQTIREAYSFVLAAKGYVVDVADGGRAALKLATANEPDLILLDLIMPGVSGVEFLRRYDLSKHPKVKVILFSNSQAVQDAKEALRLGAFEIILKSHFTPDQTVESIERAFKGQKAIDPENTPS